jgi:hypothetical protein
MDALVEIKRFEHDTNKANRGVVFLNKDFFGFSLERPNLNNMPYRSRINPGEYVARKVHTEERGDFWLLDDANGRTEIIMFHPGSLMEDFKGCIGLGAEVDLIFGKRAISETQFMCKRFMEETKNFSILRVLIT